MTTYAEKQARLIVQLAEENRRLRKRNARLKTIGIKLAERLKGFDTLHLWAEEIVRWRKALER